MTSLPPALLDQLLSELSTLASVYHKPPESFVGKGRFGADAIQRAAIQEQKEDAAENPIAASAAAAAANGTGTTSNGIENLLDIDFDGGAPASLEQASATATPDRVASPSSASQSAGGGMADMMGMFDAPAAAPPAAQTPFGGANDLMNGFEGLDLSGNSAPPPPGQQLGHTEQKSNGGGSGDLLDLM
jgi:AP-1 complex subunit beta-1